MNPAEDYILNRDEPFRSILLHLQLVIEQLIPEVELVYKWGIPAYYLKGKKPFCYMNQAKDYVDLGFWRSAYLTKHLDVLVSENRSVIKSLRYYSLEDIDETILQEVLEEAYSYKDEKFYK